MGVMVVVWDYVAALVRNVYTCKTDFIHQPKALLLATLKPSNLAPVPAAIFQYNLTHHSAKETFS